MLRLSYDWLENCLCVPDRLSYDSSSDSSSDARPLLPASLVKVIIFSLVSSPWCSLKMMIVQSNVLLDFDTRYHPYFSWRKQNSKSLHFWLNIQLSLSISASSSITGFPQHLNYREIEISYSLSARFLRSWSSIRKSRYHDYYPQLDCIKPSCHQLRYEDDIVIIHAPPSPAVWLIMT